MKKKVIKIYFIIISFLALVIYGCGNGSDGSSNWSEDNSYNVVRVSNLKGRVIVPINDNSIRNSTTRPYFSLLSAQGTRVFIEDNSSLYAIADVNGNFIIPNVPEGKHRVIANVVSGTTTYRQRSDVIDVTGQYETQEIPNSIELAPALYSLKIHLNDLKNSSPIFGKVNIWGFSFDAVNGIVDAGPFPAGDMSKEIAITAIGYKDLKTLINFGEEYNSEIFVNMTPSTSTDSNQAPFVEIKRLNTIVRTNEEIELDGKGFDPEGDVISWKWSADSGKFYNETSQKTTYLTPASSGRIKLSLTGSDSKGAKGYAVLYLDVQQGGSPGVNPNNKPPVTPNTPYPENMSTGMAKDLTLTWNCSDPNNDKITYTVNFGKQGSDLKVIATNLDEPQIKVKDLEANTKYYWQVTAYDVHYASSISELWQFSTGDLDNKPPYTPTLPSPANLAEGVGNQVDFTWSGGDPDGDLVTYRLYLATASTWIPSEPTNLTQIKITNLLKFNYKGLERGATYNWQIIAADQHGTEVAGPVWTFSTEEPENNEPSYASITEPQDGATEVSVNQKLRWIATDEDGDTLYYDVYFGTEANPPLVSASQPSQIYDPGTLLNNTKYYWRISVSDGRVANPKSDIWSFTTEVVTDEKPYVVSVTTPTSDTTPLRLVFSEYIDKSKESIAFSFTPAISGTWTWSSGNTVAEFIPNGGSWLPGSYNRFNLIANVLEDATGNKIESPLLKKFDVPSSVPVPTGYHSSGFPRRIPANTTVSISVPDLEYGKNSYVVAIADGDPVSPSFRANLTGISEDIIRKDPTYVLRLEEAKLMDNPIKIHDRKKANRLDFIEPNIGDSKNFYLNNIATDTLYPNNILHTKLAKKSENTLVYLDDNITDANRENVAQNVLNVFDNNILSKVRNAFGNEPEVGVDGESRISIVLMKLSPYNTTAGFYSSADLYARNPSNIDFRISNECKVFYIKYGMEDSTTFGTLAHEFQHMINYYQKNKSLNYYSPMIFEEVWLNEALSKYSEEVCGYSLLDGDVNTTVLVKDSMQNNRDLSLTHWGENTINCYGQVYLFMHFLAYPGRYNSDSSILTRALVSGNGGNLIGEANIEAVTGEPFEETMAKWAISLLVNNHSSTSPTAYAINNINLRGSYNGVSLPGYPIDTVISPITLNDLPYDNSVRFFKKASNGSGDTTITITSGTQPVVLWLLDERE